MEALVQPLLVPNVHAALLGPNYVKGAIIIRKLQGIAYIVHNLVAKADSISENLGRLYVRLGQIYRSHCATE